MNCPTPDSPAGSASADNPWWHTLLAQVLEALSPALQAQGFGHGQARYGEGENILRPEFVGGHHEAWLPLTDPVGARSERALMARAVIVYSAYLGDGVTVRATEPAKLSASLLLQLGYQTSNGPFISLQGDGDDPLLSVLLANASERMMVSHRDDIDSWLKERLVNCLDPNVFKGQVTIRATPTLAAMLGTTPSVPETLEQTMANLVTEMQDELAP